MRSYTNNRVTGTDSRTTWEARLQDRHTEMLFFDSPTVKFEQTPRGIRANAIIPGQPVPAQVIYGRPFQVYNVPNNSASPEQRALYTMAAVALGVPINIDDYTFQVRSGLVGCRSFLADLNEGAFNVLGETYSGNFEAIQYCPGTDFVGDLAQAGGGGGESDGQFDDPLMENDIDFGSSLITFGDTLLSDFGATTICSQVIVDPTPDEFGETYASIWLELFDVANETPTLDQGINIQMWGRRFLPEQAGPLNTAPFPTGGNIIPIAVFNRHIPMPADTRLAFTQVEQIQWGNLVNRYPMGVPVWRGRWAADNLTGQCFYPNDEVFDDSGGGPAAGWGRYTYIGAAPGKENSAPHTDPTNWVKTSN